MAHTAPANLTNQAGFVLLGPGRACVGSFMEAVQIHLCTYDTLAVEVGFFESCPEPCYDIYE